MLNNLGILRIDTDIIQSKQHTNVYCMYNIIWVIYLLIEQYQLFQQLKWQKKMC